LANRISGDYARRLASLCSVRAIFSFALRDSQFGYVVGEVGEKVQLRIVLMNFIHPLDVADCPIHVTGNSITPLFYRFLAQRRRSAAIGVKVVLDRLPAFKQGRRLESAIGEAPILIPATRLTQRLGYLPPQHLFDVLRSGRQSSVQQSPFNEVSRIG